MELLFSALRSASLLSGMSFELATRLQLDRWRVRQMSKEGSIHKGLDLSPRVVMLKTLDIQAHNFIHLHSTGTASRRTTTWP